MVENLIGAVEAEVVQAMILLQSPKLELKVLVEVAAMPTKMVILLEPEVSVIVLYGSTNNESINISK